ncbi:hypothetical protein DWB68_15440 [Galactobacter valiniphilus]|uniref:Uncharacterized protein n=1 Tax=Galactobacter valiniphilus TaxID=2676122 RepID=A0A399J6W4_9MICC|nr:hypothetical protein [Galactobacter valiniphilus]RII40900.1 hypothetical protein DWB68_15440 [Galactobacter valiniphilus]
MHALALDEDVFEQARVGGAQPAERAVDHELRRGGGVRLGDAVVRVVVLIVLKEEGRPGVGDRVGGDGASHARRTGRPGSALDVLPTVVVVSVA